MIVNLNSIQFGEPSNPPVVILHGLFGSSSNWRTIASRLSTRFYVLCVDLRNHGKSGWSDSMSYLD
ncbi:MAG: alpha/beta fold hydrolase, partial [Gammaproteobacteria bacterium]|nr:alpha/beta fold hydrolase [Gammaproteobacteria bacterium]